MEFKGVRIQPVPLSSVLHFTLESCFHVNIQQNGQVGHQATRRIIDQRPDFIQVLLMSVPLVGNGRIEIAVGEYDLAGGQPRPYDLFHDLRACGLI